MTHPGELDKVPIKVVPIYFDPVVEQAPEEPLEPEVVVEPEPADAPRRRLGIVGGLSVVAAIVAAVLTGVGVGVASAGAYDAGTVLAWAAIVVSAAAVLGGLVALIVGWGRWAGAVAVVLGLAANPWLLATVLGALAPA